MDNIGGQDRQSAEYLMQYSPLRKNIIAWYRFSTADTILLMGSESVEITAYLCQQAGQVVLVEPDKKQADLEYECNQKYQNLKIINGGLEDICIDEKHGYAICIGALARAEEFTGGQSPCEEMIFYMKKSSDSMILAIDNAMGIRYWSGEERPDGLLSNREIDKLLKNSGMKEWSYYYPVPDYRLTTHIYSDDCLPKAEAFNATSPSYKGDRVMLFDEVSRIKEICNRGLFDQFSNSYLIIGRW